MRFKLGESTIICIYDTQHLNIICIISYSDIFPYFQHYYHYNIYVIILMSLHCTAVTSSCLLFVIHNKFIVCNTGKITTIHVCRLIIFHTPPTIQANIAYFFVGFSKTARTNIIMFMFSQ